LNAAAHNQSDTRFVIGGSLLSISGPFANEQLFAIFGPQAGTDLRCDVVTPASPFA
jgi:hypothetical protein